MVILKKYWCDAPVFKNYDISTLKPQSNGHSESKFETAKAANHYKARLVQRISKPNDLSDLRTSLLACGVEDAASWCGCLYCPRCAREYRRWFISELLQLVEWYHRSELKVVTILLAGIPLGDLTRYDLHKSHGMLRKALCRAMPRVIAVGGTELEFKTGSNSWIPHVHLLIIDAKADGLAKFCMAWKKKFSRGVKVQELRDLPRQLSYLQKMVTYHRPTGQSGERRSRPYPLPRQQVEELMRWGCQYTFEDVFFGVGVRRRGSKIVST